MATDSSAAPLHDEIIVWYQLVDAQGVPYNNSTKSSVWMAPDSMMLQLQKTIQAENYNSLRRCVPTHVCFP
jgi:hypothetical protein